MKSIVEIRAAHFVTAWLLCLLSIPASAADLWWDPVPGTSGPGDGAGQWSNLGSLTNWWNGSANVPWNHGDNAVIGFNTATATTITLTNKIIVGGITFSNVGSAAYTIAASSTTSLPVAAGTNILFTGASPAITQAAHTSGQVVELFSASVISTGALSVVANSLASSFVRFNNITNNFAGGNLRVGTPGNASYGVPTALYVDFNTPTGTDPYASIVNNLTNLTVYSNASFRISGHNSGSIGTIRWPQQITISGDGRNGNEAAWIVTGNVGDNFVANVVLAGDSTIDFNAGAANKVYTLYGVISGAGRLMLVSGNSVANRETCVLTNASTYVGPTVVAGGTTLQLIGGNNRLPTGTALTLGASATPVALWNAYGRLLLGNASGPVSQTVAGLASDSLDNLARVYGGNSGSISYLTINSAASNYFGGAIGGTAATDKNIGIILTGGGDAPGLNAVIRGIAKRARKEKDWEVYGSIEAFNGVLNEPQEIIKLTRRKTAGIHVKGGTILKTTNKANPIKFPVVQNEHHLLVRKNFQYNLY